MKFLIIRTSSTKVEIKSYNMQEIGLAKALIKKGHQCDIIYYAYDGIYREEKIKADNEKKEITVYWLNGRGILNNAIFNKKKLIEICKNYDVIQVAEYDQYTSYFLTKAKIKPVVIYHGPYYSEFKKKYNMVNKMFDKLFLKKYLKEQPLIITKSYLSEDYLKGKGFNNIYTIGVGIDKDRFNLKNEELSNEVKKLMSKIGDRKIILYIGQLEERRNIEFIIKVYSKIYNNDKNTVLLIIGKGREEYVNKCKEIVRENNIVDNVIFHPKMNQEDLSIIYKNSSAFLLPTFYEIFGMVLLEAMYFGVPTITTYNGGSSMLIEDNKNGYIIKELDENKWAEKVNYILKTNNDEIINNAKHTIEKFTWDNLVEKFIEVYNKASQEEL